MLPQKKIVVEIDEEGNCSIDGQGFQGPECGNFIGEIEKSLGQRTSQRNKREYTQRQTTRQRNLQKGKQ
jgi:hypothetical protein